MTAEQALVHIFKRIMAILFKKEKEIENLKNTIRILEETQ